jgi:stage III sporulation protein AF
MDDLRKWIITMVSITILSTIIEKFAPQGSTNKYVKLVCGLAVTVVIAMPVLNFLKGDFALENVAWNEYVKLSEVELKQRIERLEREDSEQMLELYRQSLIADIKTRFKAQGEYLVTNVDAVLYEGKDDDKYGMIRALYLTLEPGSQNRTGILSGASTANIRNELSQVFAVDKDNIIIDQSRFNKGE